MDFGVGNIFAALNFMRGEKAAHYSRIQGENMERRRMARYSGDPNWRDYDVSPNPDEAMQAVWADLIPFGLGDFLGPILAPTSNQQNYGQRPPVPGQTKKPEKS